MPVEEIAVNYDQWLMAPYEYPDEYDFSCGTAHYIGTIDDWGHDDPDKYDDEYEERFECYKKSMNGGR